MIYGYARISIYEERKPKEGINLLVDQLEALLSYGVDQENIVTNTNTGEDNINTQLKELLSKAQKGDTIVVASLLSLARNINELLYYCGIIKEKELILVSIQENIDTSLQPSYNFLDAMGQLKEFEHDRISKARKARGQVYNYDRTNAKLRNNAKNKAGKLIYSRINHKTKEAIAREYAKGYATIKSICDKHSITSNTLYRILDELGIERRS